MKELLVGDIYMKLYNQILGIVILFLGCTLYGMDCFEDAFGRMHPKVRPNAQPEAKPEDDEDEWKVPHQTAQGLSAVKGQSGGTSATQVSNKFVKRAKEVMSVGLNDFEKEVITWHNTLIDEASKDGEIVKSQYYGTLFRELWNSQANSDESKKKLALLAAYYLSQLSSWSPDDFEGIHTFLFRAEKQAVSLDANVKELFGQLQERSKPRTGAAKAKDLVRNLSIRRSSISIDPISLSARELIEADDFNAKITIWHGEVLEKDSKEDYLNTLFSILWRSKGQFEDEEKLGMVCRYYLGQTGDWLHENLQGVYTFLNRESKPKPQVNSPLLKEPDFVNADTAAVVEELYRKLKERFNSTSVSQGDDIQENPKPVAQGAGIQDNPGGPPPPPKLPPPDWDKPKGTYRRAPNAGESQSAAQPAEHSPPVNGKNQVPAQAGPQVTVDSLLDQAKKLKSTSPERLVGAPQVAQPAKAQIGPHMLKNTAEGNSSDFRPSPATSNAVSGGSGNGSPAPVKPGRSPGAKVVNGDLGKSARTPSAAATAPLGQQGLRKTGIKLFSEESPDESTPATPPVAAKVPAASSATPQGANDSAKTPGDKNVAKQQGGSVKNPLPKPHAHAGGQPSGSGAAPKNVGQSTGPVPPYGTGAPKKVPGGTGAGSASTSAGTSSGTPSGGTPPPPNPGGTPPPPPPPPPGQGGQGPGNPSGNTPQKTQEQLSVGTVLAVTAVVGLGIWAFKTYYWDQRHKTPGDIALGIH